MQLTQLTPTKQLAPKQQPLRHDCTLQTHAPFTHAWPLRQGLPPPHEHAPAAQLSEVFGWQAAQAAPLTPHVASDGGLQVSPEQQPAQDSAHAWQTPLEQTPPLLQTSQAIPPAPHAAPVLPGRQAPFWQHPLGQPTALHTHLPAAQASPSPHAGRLPQVHAPATQPSAFFGSQAAQAAPFPPQVASDGALQLSPAQQPAGQDAALHTHTPPTQRWPGSHEGEAPHRQSPSQASARSGSQVAQPPPRTPHDFSDAARQDAPLQQPAGHDAALHTHSPAWQCWPAAHATPAPHAQPPFTQPSARAPLHAVQAFPGPPHASALTGSVHFAPLQQPAHPAQLAHAPLLQRSPWLHGAQAAPWIPQAIADGTVQTAPLQQPAGQDLPLHTQAPRAHSWPATQGAPLPQLHAPPPHASAKSGSQAAQAVPGLAHALAVSGSQLDPLQQPAGHDAASHKQAPFAQRWPGAQSGPLPQAQTPATHPSARAPSQATHEAPCRPQAVVEGDVHFAPAQQPAGQEPGVHAHWPPTHS